MVYVVTMNPNIRTTNSSKSINTNEKLTATAIKKSKIHSTINNIQIFPTNFLRKKSKVSSMIKNIKHTISSFLTMIKNPDKTIKEKSQLIIIRPISLNLLTRTQLSVDHHRFLMYHLTPSVHNYPILQTHTVLLPSIIYLL